MRSGEEISKEIKLNRRVWGPEISCSFWRLEKLGNQPEDVELKTVEKIRREVNLMGEKKESVVPFLVFLITLAIGVIVLVRFMLF